MSSLQVSWGLADLGWNLLWMMGLIQICFTYLSYFWYQEATLGTFFRIGFLLRLGFDLYTVTSFHVSSTRAQDLWGGEVHFSDGGKGEGRQHLTDNMWYTREFYSRVYDLDTWLSTSLLLGIMSLSWLELITWSWAFPPTPLCCLMFPTAVLKEGCNKMWSAWTAW